MIDANNMISYDQTKPYFSALEESKSYLTLKMILQDRAYFLSTPPHPPKVDFFSKRAYNFKHFFKLFSQIIKCYFDPKGSTNAQDPPPRPLPEI